MNNPEEFADANDAPADVGTEEVSAFQWASDGLNQYLSSANSTAKYHCNSVFEHGVYHANFEFTTLFSTGGCPEEHQTSTYMGCISSHLSWYHILAELSGRNESQKCAWGATPKAEEAKNGTDFGVVIEVLGSHPTRYNIAYFQAKILDESGKLDINQYPTGYTREGDIKAEADEAFEAWCIENMAIDESNFSKGKKYHQIVKLAITDAKLKKKSTRAGEHSFSHYVIWLGDGKTPVTIPLHSVRSKLKNRNSKRQFVPSGISYSAVEIKNDPNVLFPEFLVQGQFEGSLGWASLIEADVLQFVEGWTEMGSRWMVVERTSGGMAEKLKLAKKGLAMDVPQVSGTVSVIRPKSAKTQKYKA